MFHPTSHRMAFFQFCASELARLDGGAQTDFLALIAGSEPWGSENDPLVSAIARLPQAWELARHYRIALEGLARVDRETIARLEAIPRPSLLRRLF